MKNKLLQRLGWQKHHEWYEYGGLALLIMLPLLLPGYILTLDLVFTPHIAWPAEVTNTYPLQVLLWVLHAIIPADYIEKIILFAILLCSGVGIFRLFMAICDARFAQTGAYFAGLLYMINPFVYSRFMAGQWLVLLGYALLPFFVRSVFMFIQSPSLWAAVRVATWLFMIVTVSLHQAGVAAIILALLLIAGLYRNKGTMMSRYSKGCVVICVLPIALSSFWLLPALFGNGPVGASVADFTSDDFAAFSTVGGVGAVLRLQGFWVEARDLYVLPQSIVPLWGVWFLCVWGLVVTGVVAFWKTHRRIVIVAISSIVIGCIVAVSPLIEWASHYSMVAAGYREPHKFVTLIALGFSILGGFGLVRVVGWCHQKYGQNSGNSVKIVGLLLPIIITPTMFWGSSGQLSPKHYPSEWYDINELLQKETSDKDVLFLPWHQYANYGFSGRIIANPAEKFFTVPIISSDDPEFKEVTSTTPNTTKDRVGRLLKEKRLSSVELRSMHISHVLLAKEQDYRQYGYLGEDSGLQIVRDNGKVTLYKVKE